MSIIPKRVERQNVTIRSFLLSAGFACAVLGFAEDGAAQEWRFEPEVIAGFEYDDNAVLSIRTDTEAEISGFVGDLRALIDYSSPKTDFLFEPRLRVRSYNDSRFDSTDGFGRLDWRHRLRSTTWRLRADFGHEATRTAERGDLDQEITDPDDLINDDTGLTQLEGDRTRLRLRPEFGYRFSNQASMRIAVDHFDVRFDEVFLNILDDFTDTRGEATFSRSFSAVTSGLLLGGIRNFANDDNINEFDGYFGMLGFERSLSEKVDLMFLVGAETADFGSDNSLGSQTEAIADVSIVRRLETIRLLAQYRRQITANGIRIPEIRDNITLSFIRLLSEKISANIGARLYRATPIGGSSFFERNFVQLGGGLGWSLTPTFSIDFDLRYTFIDRGGNIGESADANRIAIRFVWAPNSPNRFRTRQ